MNTVPPLLEVRSASRVFGGGGLLRPGREVTAVREADLVLPGDRPAAVAVAGESGSGKTTLARLMLGMLAPSSGEVRYRGLELRQMTRGHKRSFRREVQAVFQDPFEVFNPFYKVDHALAVPVGRFFPELTGQQRRERIEEGLRSTGLRPEETLGRYPHQLSGGQRQRVMVARALLLDPRVVIADEPVSMVDASLRATILESLYRSHRERGISIVYITHDLTTAFQLCRTILVMYAGSVVEVGEMERVMKEPKHPYTRLLVGSIPHADPRRRWGEAAAGPGAGADEAGAVESRERAAGAAEPETSPPGDAGQGCVFASRCPSVTAVCRRSRPPLLETDPTRGAACFLYEGARPLDSERAAALTHGEE